MAKTYTAQEMRERAKGCEFNGDLITTAMLRQAADAIEREEKREKKYEYAEKEDNGRIRNYHADEESVLMVLIDESSTIVRREVGEWEEVK